ncbi:MAG TPA: hypothetical protein VK961_08320 [Chthoniobacter sp.]|nr:hypothetical protein [Chthoniobacter sp.]
MLRSSFFLILALTCTLAPAQAAPKGGKKPASTNNDFGISPQTPRLVDFQNDDLSLALQVLARQAKVNLAVSDDLKDTITMRLENKTPREAIDIIIATKDLTVEEQRGTLYIRSKNPGAQTPLKVDGADASGLKDLAAAAFAPAMAAIYDALLDYSAKPETAQKLARSTRALYEALVAEGFTKEQAFQIVLSDRGLPSPGSKK